MPKREVLWDPVAWAEAEEAFEYYAERSRRAAEVFRKRLDDAVEQIAENGEAFPVFDDGARRCLLYKYPFGVLFTMDDETAVITVVMHTHRLPGYYKKRF